MRKSLIWISLALACASCKREAAPRPRQKPAVVVVDEQEESVGEAEPNDTLGTAQLLPLGETIAGALNGGSDHDTYRVELSGALQVLRVETSGSPEVDLAVVLMERSGKTVVRIDNARTGGGETLPNATLEPGTYYLQVTARAAPAAKGTESAYRLRVSARAPEPGEEREPNDEQGKATALAWEGEAVGYCGWRNDIDWYALEIPPATAETLLRIELDGVDGVRPALALSNSGKTLFKRVAPARGEPVVLANVRPPAGRDPLHLVLRCGEVANVETRYALRVAITPAAGSEVEPNDSMSSATSFDAVQAVRGVLADRLDSDWLRPDLPNGAVVRVIARPALSLDVALAVLDGRGALLQESDARRSGGPEVLVPLRWEAGMVLRLRAPRGASNDALAPYRLTVEQLEQGNWEREPNGTVDRAEHQISSSDGPLRGFLYPADDVDVFLIRPSSAQLRLKAQLAGASNVRLELRDGDTVLASTEPSGGERTMSLSARVTPGQAYAVRIYGDGAINEHDAHYAIEGLEGADPTPVGPPPLRATP